MSVNRLRNYIEAIYTRGNTIKDLLKHKNIPSYCNVHYQERRYVLNNRDVLDKINSNDVDSSGMIYDISDLTVKNNRVRLVKYAPKTKKFVSEFGFVSNKLDPVLLVLNTAGIPEDDPEYERATLFFS